VIRVTGVRELVGVHPVLGSLSRSCECHANTAMVFQCDRCWLTLVGIVLDDASP